MNFTEIDFWPRLFGGLILIGLLRLWPAYRKPEWLSAFDRTALAILSLYLLSCVGFLTTVIFCSIFLVALGMIRTMFRLSSERRSLVLWIGIPLLFLPLLYYKYRVFIVRDVFVIDGLTFASIAIPAGISFYTFQTVGMLVDASKLERWRPRFVDYLNFIGFFPQVVAGPIERRDALFPQLEKFSFRWSPALLNSGTRWIALGLFYKVCLSDNLGAYIDRDAMDSAWTITLTTVLFGLKIYFDFCAYSLIALGFAKCLGIELTLNFKSPYWSGNIRDFWRRWHISLSYWFRDYVYIPLGGSRGGRWALNLLIVFVVSGIWHGAGWGFLIWGGLHGIFVVVSHAMKNRVKLPAVAAWVLTMAVVFLAWLPFYETRMDVLWKKTRTLFTGSAWSLDALHGLVGSFGMGDLVTLGASVGLGLLALACEGLSLARTGKYFAHASSPITTVACVLGILFLGAPEANEFIYFAF